MMNADWLGVWRPKHDSALTQEAMGQTADHPKKALTPAFSHGMGEGESSSAS